MMFKSKEDYEAWIKFQDYCFEINLCMKEQGFMYYTMSDDEIDICLYVYNKIMEEYAK